METFQNGFQFDSERAEIKSNYLEGGRVSD